VTTVTLTTAEAQESRRRSIARLLYLDWLRGLAVLMMILWHVVDAWTRLDDRDSELFRAVGFTGGWAAPLFLLLAGVSIPLAGESRLARGTTRAEASWTLQRRGWLVFALAHLFRLQSFILNPAASWNSLLKPDILNILGLGIVLTAWLWGRARDARWTSGLLWLIVPAVIVVVVITPLAHTWEWPTVLHPRLEAYIRPVGNYGVFSLFPAVSYVLIGGYLGMRIAAGRGREAATHLRIAVAGVVVWSVGGALTAQSLRPWAMWGDPVAGVAVRIGMMLLLVSYSRWAFRSWPAERFSRMVVLGRNSLFVYWVHVELVYGTFSFVVRRRLDLGWSLVGYVLVVGLMYGLAAVWSRRQRGTLVPEHMAAPPPGFTTPFEPRVAGGI
jgi:uncharacterized membrane protein